MVAIALIAFLAALLLPALSQAKGKSYATVCRSNLRELGMSLRMYGDDSFGAYPYMVSLPAANARGVGYWFDALAQYVPNARWGGGVFNCPAYQGIAYEGEASVNARGQLSAVYSASGSYAYNAAGRRQSASGAAGQQSAGLGFSLIQGQPVPPPVRDVDVKSPADLYVIGDAPLFAGSWGTSATVRLGGAADYNSFAWTTADITVARQAHQPSPFNMLFADAHAASVTPSVLLGTNAACRSRWNHDNQP